MSLVFETLLLTGNRPSAVFGAKLKDLDENNCRIALPDGNGKKRNGVATIPQALLEKLKAHLAARPGAEATEPLLVSPDGKELDRKNVLEDFKKAMTLAFVRMEWPSDNSLVCDVDPVEVGHLIYTGRKRGFDGPPPRDPEKLARRNRLAQAVNEVATLIGPKVAQRLDNRDMYTLRKTHITWARQFANADSVKLQTGHTAQDTEERF